MKLFKRIKQWFCKHPHYLRVIGLLKADDDRFSVICDKCGKDLKKLTFPSLKSINPWANRTKYGTAEVDKMDIDRGVDRSNQG